MASYIVGNAWCNEKGGATGGKPGDQKQSGSGDDYKGEVKMQSMYTRPSGWWIFRPISDEHANKIAERMRTACNNPNLGYGQDDTKNGYEKSRYGVIRYGIDSKTPVNCDCSSLVRACIKEATGKDPGDFYTVTEPDMLDKTGLFQKRIEYKTGMQLFTGDVLCSIGKGHTMIVVIGDKRGNGSAGDDPNSKTGKAGGKSLEQLVDEILAGKYGTGTTRQKKVEKEGWNYDTVRAAVNCAAGAAAFNKKSTTDNTNKMLVASTRTVAAKSKDNSLKGSYRVTEDLNLRTGPEAKGTVSVIMPKGGVVRCYGYYTKNDKTGTRWLYVCYEGIVGYASNIYLDKIKK